MQPVPTPAAVRVSRHGSFSRTLWWVLPLAIVGCRDAKIAAYSVPKEAAAELRATAPTQPAAPKEQAMPSDATHAGLTAGASSAAMPPDAGIPTASGDALTWTAPAAWQAKPASMMRKATFTITGRDGATAELAVSAFPGDVGGEPANVNRWRGQVGLPTVGDADAIAAIQRLEANGLKMGVVDLTAGTPNAVHLLGAMVPLGDATWFFKLTGPTVVVAEAKPAFLDFLKTVRPAAATQP